MLLKAPAIVLLDETTALSHHPQCRPDPPRQRRPDHRTRQALTIGSLMGQRVTDRC